MNRRSFLKATTTLGISSALAGCGTGGFSAGATNGSSGNATNATKNRTAGLPAPVSNPNQYASEFANVVNMVEAGADPTGKKDVTPIIEREIASNTLLVFPKGTYKMNSRVRRTSLRNVGIIGQGAVLKHGRVDAIHGFDVTEGEFSGPAQLFKFGSKNRFHKGRFVFGGFVADWRAKNTGMQIVSIHTSGEAIVENTKALGIHSLGCQGPFRLNPATPDAKVLARGLDVRHGGKTYQYTINTRDTSDGGPYSGRSWATSGIMFHPFAKGLLRVERCVCGGWPDNGIYVASKQPEATVHVIGCTAANSHVSNIRITGTNSRIENCLVVVDSNFDKQRFYNEQRPIRLDSGSCTVKNTQIKQIRPTGWSITVQHGMDKAVLENVSVEIYNKPQVALVVDDGVGTCKVNSLSVTTKGWRGTRASLFRGWPDVARKISVNGRAVA